MPLYEYKCKQCGKTIEFLENTNQVQTKYKCSSCGSEQMEKLLSMPAGVIISRERDHASAGKEGGIASNASGNCCGMTNPCADPKRCCRR